MPNCDFYAAGRDLVAVLQVVLDLGDCRMFERYSPPGEDLLEFRSVEEVARRYPIGDCEKTGLTMLALYPVRAGGELLRRRIELKLPRRQGGETFRWTMEGWGLIDLHLGGVDHRGLLLSSTNHNSQRRAFTWEDATDRLGPSSAWDWAEVARASRRINHRIRARLAVRKLGSRAVLPEADVLLRSGMTPHQ